VPPADASVWSVFGHMHWAQPLRVYRLLRRPTGVFFLREPIPPFFSKTVIVRQYLCVYTRIQEDGTRIGSTGGFDSPLRIPAIAHARTPDCATFCYSYVAWWGAPSHMPGERRSGHECRCATDAAMKEWPTVSVPWRGPPALPICNNPALSFDSVAPLFTAPLCLLCDVCHFMRALVVTTNFTARSVLVACDTSRSSARARAYDGNIAGEITTLKRRACPLPQTIRVHIVFRYTRCHLS
jgi:hypothetical protein